MLYFFFSFPSFQEHSENTAGNGGVFLLQRITKLCNNFCEFNTDWIGGYHDDNNVCVANTISIIWSGASAADINANNAAATVCGGDIRTPRAAIPETGKRFKGWRFQKPSGN